MCALQYGFERLELVVIVDQAAGDPHGRACKPAIQETQRRMKLNCRTVRDHLVAEPQLIFMETVASSRADISITDGIEFRIGCRLPCDRVGECVVGRIVKILLTRHLVENV